MKRPLKIVMPFILIVLLLTLSACEISHDEGEDIATPDAGQPVTAVPGATEEPDADELPRGEQYAAPDAPDVPPEPGTSLVKLAVPAALQAAKAEMNSQGYVATGIGSLDETLQQLGATSVEPIIEPVAEGSGESMQSLAERTGGVNQLYVVKYDESIPPEQASAALEQDPNVEYAEPNFIAGITANPVDVPALLNPNDPYYTYQWHFDTIQMPAAWDMSTGQSVTIAVVDTGIDFGASDLANTNRVPGYDFVSGDNDATDDQGHGTHVAGTVAQTTNNGLGVAGVAFNATLMPVKVLGASGQGSYETIIQGIIYAVDQGADVINMSLAGRNGSQAMEDAINYAYQKNVVVVAAAGNSNGPVQFPAAYNNTIAIGAVQFDKTRAPYSNYGPQIDLMAPGGNTKVDQNNDGYGDGVLQQTFKASGSGYSYRFFEGTSMASPHVAAVAGLMKSIKPNASVDEIKNAMMQTAVNVGPTDQLGAGLVQAASALNAIGGGQPLPPTDTPTPVPPTTEPTTEPTVEPTTEPTSEPTAEPTTEPTTEPTIEPTTEPTAEPPTATPILPTVEPTAEPTATSLPLPAGELLTNGGFETDEAWVFGDTPIRGGYDTSVVLSGNRSARVGATSGYNAFSFSSVWQKVTIPAEASRVVLETNTYPLTEDSCGTDLQYIAILNANFRMTMPLSVGLSDSRTWEHNTFDVTDMRGQTIYVYFSVLNRGCSGLTAMYVDDVSLRWE